MTSLSKLAQRCSSRRFRSHVSLAASSSLRADNSHAPSSFLRRLVRWRSSFCSASIAAIIDLAFSFACICICCCIIHARLASLLISREGGAPKFCCPCGIDGLTPMSSGENCCVVVPSLALFCLPDVCGTDNGTQRRRWRVR